MRRRSERADPVAVKQHTLLSSVAVEHWQLLLDALAILDTQTRAPLRPCADALERSLLIVDFSECGGSGNLPRIIHIDPAEDGGAARGDAVAVLDRWRRRHAAGHRAPHTLNIAAPLGERSVGCEARQRRAPRLAETADSADSADARAAVRQRTAARAAGAAQIGDHGARAAGEDGALLHHADSRHRRVARLRDGRADRAEHLNHRHLAKILIDRAAGPVSSSRGGFGVLAV